MPDKSHLLRLLQQNRLDEALTLGAHLCDLFPRDAEIWLLFAHVHARRGAFNDVMDCCDKAIALHPGNAGAHYTRGVALQNLRRSRDAEQSYREVLRIDPRQPDARNNLGLVLLDLGRAEEAMDMFRDLSAGQKDRPTTVLAHTNLALALMALDRYRDAEASARNALALDPHYAPALDNLGCALREQGRVEEAIVQYRHAVSRQPGFLAAHHNLLFALNYCSRLDTKAIFAEHRRWAQLHADPLLEHRGYDNERDAAKRLRVGYVSPDFRSHSVAFFLEPLLASHDRSQFEVYCYSNVARPDAITDRLRELADRWRPIFDRSDRQVVNAVREDRIDILVDLAGHGFGHRLLVFARKPAPVQATWLGYPNTTGMMAMDYRVTDAWADPPGDSDTRHSETLLRLPRGFLCYQPLPDSPPVSELPSRATGRITFGCFNNSAKISAPVLDAWSEILKAVPGSRLLLKSRQLRDPPLRRYYECEFQNRGVDPQRVEMVGRIESKHGHMDLYGRVDIGLDPFPYNGTTTSCEALWMGVPVVVLAGDRHAGRVGVSLLTSVNLTELIAQTVPEYQRIAVELARNPERLAAYRSGMRDRMRQSPLLDAAGFTRAMESAYRDMWRRWCQGDPVESHRRIADQSE